MLWNVQQSWFGANWKKQLNERQLCIFTATKNSPWRERRSFSGPWWERSPLSSPRGEWSPLSGPWRKWSTLDHTGGLLALDGPMQLIDVFELANQLVKQFYWFIKDAFQLCVESLRAYRSLLTIIMLPNQDNLFQNVLQFGICKCNLFVVTYVKEEFYLISKFCWRGT